MKYLLFSLFTIVLLASSCSTSTEEETNNATTEEPSSTDIIAENMAPTDEPMETVEASNAENSSEENSAPIKEGDETITRGATVENNVTLDDVAGKKNTKGSPKPNINGTNDSKPMKMLSHELFDGLLRKYVDSNGGVDYAGFKKSEGRLQEYLKLLKSTPPESSWSKNKEMAYWINLYNAFTISAIVENYPCKSIMDVEGGKVWDKKKIQIGGKSLTLNNIEKDKLLKRFKEPRVHFAVNCAAASCPPLLNKAWTEDNIQRYFDKRAKAFINDSKHNTLAASSVKISQIFNWYAGDFGGSDKIVAYLQKYAETKIENNAKVSYKEYDWSLNKK